MATKVVWAVQGWYADSVGWETVYVAEDKGDANARYWEYRENESEFRHRIMQEEE